jgi:hypothetical protein
MLALSNQHLNLPLPTIYAKNAYFLVASSISRYEPAGNYLKQDKKRIEKGGLQATEEQ